LHELLVLLHFLLLQQFRYMHILYYMMFLFLHGLLFCFFGFCFYTEKMYVRISNFFLFVTFCVMMCIVLTRGRKIMKFSEVAQAFDSIEKVSGRLEMTRLLADLFAKVTTHEAEIVATLSLGQLHPPYIG